MHLTLCGKVFSYADCNEFVLTVGFHWQTLLYFQFSLLNLLYQCFIYHFISFDLHYFEKCHSIAVPFVHSYWYPIQEQWQYKVFNLFQFNISLLSQSFFNLYYYTSNLQILNKRNRTPTQLSVVLWWQTRLITFRKSLLR